MGLSEHILPEIHWPKIPLSIRAFHILGIPIFRTLEHAPYHPPCTSTHIQDPVPLSNLQTVVS